MTAKINNTEKENKELEFTIRNILGLHLNNFYQENGLSVPCKTRTITEDKIIKCNYCDFDVSFNALLEGFYLDSNSMISVIDPMNQPIICDTVFLQLTQPEFPYSVIYSKSVLIDNHGKGLTHFTTSPEYDKYYFVLRHRNSIETWSKSPITIGLNTTFDFTE